MNHRDLILSMGKKPKYRFLQLPHDLQDQIMEALDNNALTFYEAATLAMGNGFKISHAAIAHFHEAVRAQRRAVLYRSLASQGD